MAFKDFSNQEQGVQLLQRSLERGRLAHAYLFIGHQLDELEALARALAKTLNCLRPVKKGGTAVDCCDQCLSCRKIDHGNHADVHWVRPESKLRVVTVEQMRSLMHEIHLKTTEAEYKVAVIVAADRLNVQAANAFLKTLEEPPPKSILILLTTDPQRMLETVRSRCLRLRFATEAEPEASAEQKTWLNEFSQMAAAEQKGLLARYKLLSLLLKKLTGLRSEIESSLTGRSPLQQYEDAEADLRDRWEDELKAAIEAEYRRQRSDLLLVLQCWLRDVWLKTASTQSRRIGISRIQDSGASGGGMEALLNFPELEGTERLAARLSPKDAMENLQVLERLQRWLGTNVQEALALEVSLLKLRF